MRSSRSHHRAGALLGALALAVSMGTVTTAAHAAGSDLKYEKAETFVAVDAGATMTAAAACPAGYTAINGSFYVDSDSAGESNDLAVVASQRGSDARQWTATVSNGSAARVTGRVRVTCLGNTTVGGQAVSFGSSSDSDEFGDVEVDGFGTTDADCPPGTPVAVGAGWTLTAGDAYLVASSTGGSDWLHSFEGAGADEVTTIVYCVGATATTGTTSVKVQAVEPAKVPAKTSSFRDGTSTDAVMVCPEGSHAVAGTFNEVPAGVSYLGAESSHKELRQRFHNDSGATATVTTDVVCLTSSAVTPDGPTITEDNDAVNKRVIGGKNYLTAVVTCANFNPQCRTITGKAFLQNSDGSRGARVATGKVKYAAPSTGLRMRIGGTATVDAGADKLILVLKANGVTVTIKGVDVHVP